MRVYLNFYDNNSMRVELRGLASYATVDTPAYVNSASVSCTVEDSAGTPLTGVTWPLTLAYEAGSDGNYSGVVEENANTTVGEVVTVKVTATDAGEQGYWVIPAEVMNRDHRTGYG